MDIKKTGSIRLLFLFVCFTGMLQMNAQNMPYVISYENGSSNISEQSWNIVEGCNGDMFIACTGGVLWYNGFQWKKIPILRGRIARSIFVDEGCNLYVGGFEFFGTIDFTDPLQPTFVPSDNGFLSDSGQEIWALSQHESSILMQSFSEVYEYEGEEMKQRRPPSNILLGSMVNLSTHLFPSIEGGVYLYENDQFNEFIQASEFSQQTEISSIAAWNRDSLLIGTTLNGLWISNRQGQVLPFEGAWSERMKSEQINRLLITSNGKIVIGTILNGIYIYDEHLKPISHINNVTGLSNNTILSLFEDSKGDIWVGTDRGINTVFLNSLPLQHLNDTRGRLGTVHAYAKHKGSTYIGTNQGVYWDENQRDDFSLIQGSQGQVWSFLDMADDLICGHNSGIYLAQNGRWDQICDITGGWHLSRINDSALLASTYTGFVLLERDKVSWEFRRIQNSTQGYQSFHRLGSKILGYNPNLGFDLIELDEDFNTLLKTERIQELPLSRNPLLAANKSDFYVLADEEWFKIDDQNEIQFVEGELPDDLNFGQQFYVDWLSENRNQQPSDALRQWISDGNKCLLSHNKGLSLVNSTSLLSLTDIQLDLLKHGNEKIENGFELKSGSSGIDIYLKRSKPYLDIGQYEYCIVYNKAKGQWNSLSDEGHISLLNAAAGNYEILVRGDGDVEHKIAYFKVLPPWYRSFPGLILYSLIIGCIALLWNRRNKRLYEKEKASIAKAHEETLKQERILFEKQKLEKDLRNKSKQLANSALALAQKNEMLLSMKKLVKKDFSEVNKKKLSRLIDNSLKSEDEWKLFEENFNDVHEQMFKKLLALSPKISSSDLTLAGYIKMNLLSKEIAPLLHISVRSVENKRYLLRQKLNIPSHISLNDFIAKL